MGGEGKQKSQTHVGLALSGNRDTDRASPLLTNGTNGVSHRRFPGRTKRSTSGTVARKLCNYKPGGRRVNKKSRPGLIFLASGGEAALAPAHPPPLPIRRRPPWASAAAGPRPTPRWRRH